LPNVSELLKLAALIHFGSLARKQLMVRLDRVLDLLGTGSLRSDKLDNRIGVLRLTCAQACPHHSVQLALRPPAADIQRTMDLPPSDPGLILIPADDLSLHHWQRVLGWLPAVPASLSEGEAGMLLPVSA